LTETSPQNAVDLRSATRLLAIQLLIDGLHNSIRCRTSDFSIQHNS
jgi:hypothetical protein